MPTKNLARIAEANALLKGLGVETWDFLIVGDGSGTGWEKEAGWASVSIEKMTGERKLWAGAMTRGTNNVAEVMAFLQPLTWLMAREEKRRSERRVATRGYHVHLLTDSQFCRTTGTKNDRTTAIHAPIWQALDIVVRVGFILHWHWIPRNSFPMHILVDDMSRKARLRLTGFISPAKPKDVPPE